MHPGNDTWIAKPETSQWYVEFEYTPVWHSDIVSNHIDIETVYIDKLYPHWQQSYRQFADLSNVGPGSSKAEQVLLGSSLDTETLQKAISAVQLGCWKKPTAYGRNFRICFFWFRHSACEAVKQVEFRTPPRFVVHYVQSCLGSWSSDWRRC